MGRPSACNTGGLAGCPCGWPPHPVINPCRCSCTMPRWNGWCKGHSKGPTPGSLPPTCRDLVRPPCCCAATHCCGRRQGAWHCLLLDLLSPHGLAGRCCQHLTQDGLACRAARPMMSCPAHIPAALAARCPAAMVACVAGCLVGSGGGEVVVVVGCPSRPCQCAACLCVWHS